MDNPGYFSNFLHNLNFKHIHVRSYFSTSSLLFHLRNYHSRCKLKISVAMVKPFESAKYFDISVTVLLWQPYYHNYKKI